jgi:hypothetical protein
MKSLLAGVFVLFLCGAIASALDGFETVKCGTDIPKSLVGKHLSNERLVVIEARHKDLGLKDLGGSELSDRLFLGSWLICGKEYLLIEESRHNDSIVRDVLQIPAHSKSEPEFTGTCQRNNQEVSDAVVAILDNRAGQKKSGPKPRPLLSAKVAWEIDEVNAKFLRVAPDGLRCPVDGIFTEDSIY